MDTEGIATVLEEIAPSSLAESWDNVGWQVRFPPRPVSGVLVALDVTPEVVDEAAALGCNVVVAHHPLLFKPISSLDLATPRGALLARILRGEISVWAAHTNLDVVPWGTSAALAEALEVRDARVLAAVDRQDYKIVVYVPPGHAEAVKRAMAEAGAGRIGNYSFCFWEVPGVGQFRPEEGASPHIGAVGQIERVEELRVEAAVPRARLGAVLEAMRRAHPYEEVAHDVVPLANRVSDFGYGAVGSLASPSTTEQIAREAARRLSSAVCQVAGDPKRTHSRVAVVGGSGASFFDQALRSGATLFLTADVRYHDSQEAVSRGLDLVILDHFATEHPVLDRVGTLLQQKAPGVPVHVARAPSTPYVRVKP